MSFFTKHKLWLIPLLIALALAPFLSFLDLKIENYFYETGNDPNTHFWKSPFLDFMYDYGNLLGQGLFVLAVLIAILTFIFKALKPYRNPSLVIILTMILGPGISINAGLKEYWGRPRPKQIEQFGGSQQFRPFYSPQLKPPEPSKSFVCGHCSMGFMYLTLAVIGLWIGSRTLLYTGLILGAGFGILLSFVRMAQGGHFFSDTLFAALIVWCMALISGWLIYAREESA
jgi:membrane-associated PAP2 superfamily phosphatase